eukprot:1327440-Amorphochlora_amoeboformis.AAC.1
MNNSNLVRIVLTKSKLKNPMVEPKNKPPFLVVFLERKQSSADVLKLFEHKVLLKDAGIEGLVACVCMYAC